MPPSQRSAPYFRTLGKRRRKGPERGGAHRGQAADEDWLVRLNKAIGAKYGDGAPVAKLLGIKNYSLSKLKNHGQGETDLVFDASRLANIAPPKRMLDDAQYRLIEALEELRAAVRSMPAKSAEAAIEAAVARFESLVAEYTKPNEEPAHPFDRAAR